MQKKLLMLLLVVISLLAAACSADAGDPAATVERYMQAKADADATIISQLLCSEMEAVAEREARTFESVSGVRIEGMACEQVGDTPVVSCDVTIIATYGAEETEFPLTSYRVVEEDGEWKWCGEAP